MRAFDRGAGQSGRDDCFLKQSEESDRKIMIGGAAVDVDFATRQGADGYADDAGEAVQVAKRLLGLPNNLN